MTTRSYVGKKAYVSILRCDDLNDSLPWNGVDAPPLSAQHAEALARDKVAQLRNGATTRCVLGRTSLHHLNETSAWFYEFSFFTVAPSAESGRMDTFAILVLMNGNVVEPTLNQE